MIEWSIYLNEIYFKLKRMTERTFDPKYVTYYGDGNGRDQYIVFGNGGLHKER